MGNLNPATIAASFPLPPPDGMPLARACSLFAASSGRELGEDEVIRLLLLAGRAVIRCSDLSLFPPADPGRNIVQGIEVESLETEGGFLAAGDRLCALLGPFEPAFEADFLWREDPLEHRRTALPARWLEARMALHGAEAAQAILLLDDAAPEPGSKTVLATVVDAPRLLAEAAESPSSLLSAFLTGPGRVGLDLRRRPCPEEWEGRKELLYQAWRKARRLLPPGLGAAAYAAAAVLECLPELCGLTLPPLDFLLRPRTNAQARSFRLAVDIRGRTESLTLCLDPASHLGELAKELEERLDLPRGRPHFFRIRGDFYGKRDDDSLPSERDEAAWSLQALALGPSDVVEYEHDLHDPTVLRIRPL